MKARSVFDIDVEDYSRRELAKNKKKMAMKSTFIDEPHSPRRDYP
jgi:hypothetical protein